MTKRIETPGENDVLPIDQALRDAITTGLGVVQVARIDPENFRSAASLTLASEVQRWHHNEFSQEMHEDPIGEYVKFADVAPLTLTNTAINEDDVLSLRAACDWIQQQGVHGIYQDMDRVVTKLESARATKASTPAPIYQVISLLGTGWCDVTEAKMKALSAVGYEIRTLYTHPPVESEARARGESIGDDRKFCRLARAWDVAEHDKGDGPVNSWTELVAYIDQWAESRASSSSKETAPLQKYVWAGAPPAPLKHLTAHEGPFYACADVDAWSSGIAAASGAPVASTDKQQDQHGSIRQSLPELVCSTDSGAIEHSNNIGKQP